jgi:predicted ATPase
MITGFRVQDFKAFQDSGPIELKPLTVLAGSNSSGKSSILQALLLLKQTAEVSTTARDALNLAGPYVQASSFRDVVFGKPQAKVAKMTLTVDIRTTMVSSMLARHFPSLRRKSPSQRRVLDSRIELCFRSRSVDPELDPSIVVDRFAMTTSVGGEEGPQLRFRFSPQAKRWIPELSGEGLRLLPGLENRHLSGVSVRGFLPESLTLTPDISEGEALAPRVPLQPVFSNPIRLLERDLRDATHYLGPLREEPHRVYLHIGSPSPQVGSKGEFAAQVLWLEKDSEVMYRAGSRRRTRNLALLPAVNAALADLGVPHRMDIRSLESLMYQVVSPLGPRKQLTIADLGFGMSQLLPILVLGLRAEEQSLLIFEQPEIHLHPRVQANLADFFLGQAELNDGTILVETHSEHFINRIRRRVAEDETDSLKDRVSVLFVRPGLRSATGAQIETLKVDKYGTIINWPSDFLPEAADEAEAILRAGLAKRRPN